jgi:hypothetical protein
VVRDHLDGRRNHTYLLLAMMIFELGQRGMADKHPSKPQPIATST